MSMKRNVLKEKSFLFAVRVVNLYKYLSEEKNEFILSKQLIRSGTSVASLIRESVNAESKLDFIHKLSIAQKECDETVYWLELLKETKYLTQSQYESLVTDLIELLKIIRSVILTTKQNLTKIHNS